MMSREVAKFATAPVATKKSNKKEKLQMHNIRFNTTAN